MFVLKSGILTYLLEEIAPPPSQHGCPQGR